MPTSTQFKLEQLASGDPNQNTVLKDAKAFRDTLAISGFPTVNRLYTITKTGGQAVQSVQIDGSELDQIVHDSGFTETPIDLYFQFSNSNPDLDGHNVQRLIQVWNGGADVHKPTAQTFMACLAQVEVGRPADYYAGKLLGIPLVADAVAKALVLISPPVPVPVSVPAPAPTPAKEKK